MIDYSKPINVGVNTGYFLRSETTGDNFIYYVLHGSTLSNAVVSPFNEYGVCYSQNDIDAWGLEGFFTSSAVANVADTTLDTVYLVKDSDGFYVTTTLDSIRDGYGITANSPQGIIRVVMNASDGAWSGVNMGTQMLDVSQVLNSTFVT